MNRVLVIGDSNSNSTRADTTWAGHPVQAGWLFRHNGAVSSTYPAGNSPGVAMVPHVIEAVAARGAPPGWVIRRGTNGATAVWPGTIASQWAGAQADVAAAGGRPDMVVVVLGANDSRYLNKSIAYQANMDRLLSEILLTYPSAKIAIWRERATVSGAQNYKYLASHIYPAQDALLLEYPSSFLVDSTVAPMPDLVDAIHFSVGGCGGGHAAMTARMMAHPAMQ